MSLRISKKEGLEEQKNEKAKAGVKLLNSGTIEPMILSTSVRWGVFWNGIKFAGPRESNL